MTTLYERNGYVLYTVLCSTTNDDIPYRIETVVYIRSPKRRDIILVARTSPFSLIDDPQCRFMEWLSKLSTIIAEDESYTQPELPNCQTKT